MGRFTPAKRPIVARNLFFYGLRRSGERGTRRLCLLNRRGFMDNHNIRRLALSLVACNNLHEIMSNTPDSRIPNLKTKYDGCAAKFVTICAVPLVGFVIWGIATGEFKSDNASTEAVHATPQSRIDTSAPLEPQIHHEVVENNAWDGGVSQIDSYFKSNLNDYDSLQVIEWGKVTKVDGGFLVRVKYRAKNSFNAHTVEHKIFKLNTAGIVEDVTDWGEKG